MAKFQKRHYEAIAQALQDAHPGDQCDTLQWCEVCQTLAEEFRRDNPAFDPLRFMKACKPGANVRAR